MHLLSSNYEHFRYLHAKKKPPELPEAILHKLNDFSKAYCASHQHYKPKAQYQQAMIGFVSSYLKITLIYIDKKTLTLQFLIKLFFLRLIQTLANRMNIEFLS